jgi:hypothetical protein
MRCPEHFATPSRILSDPHAGRPLRVSMPIRKSIFSGIVPEAGARPVLHRLGYWRDVTPEKASDTGLTSRRDKNGRVLQFPPRLPFRMITDEAMLFLGKESLLGGTF